MESTDSLSRSKALPNHGQGTSIVPGDGFSPVKKRTNHDGVGCYSNMAARQCALEVWREGREGLYP